MTQLPIIIHPIKVDVHCAGSTNQQSAFLNHSLHCCLPDVEVDIGHQRRNDFITFYAYTTLGGMAHVQYVGETPCLSHNIFCLYCVPMKISIRVKAADHVNSNAVTLCPFSHIIVAAWHIGTLLFSSFFFYVLNIMCKERSSLYYTIFNIFSGADTLHQIDTK